MPYIATFKEVESIFQTALNSNDEITRVDCGSHGAAMSLRQRLNNWRVKDRKENETIFPYDHDLHGASAYDVLSLRVPPSEAPDSHYIYITKRKSITFTVEKIPITSHKEESQQ